MKPRVRLCRGALSVGQWKGSETIGTLFLMREGYYSATVQGG